MDSDQNRMDRLARAQELKRRGESARRRDGAMRMHWTRAGFHRSRGMSLA